MQIPDFDGVRLACKADEDEIFALLTMMHAENGFFSMNRERVRAMIRSATECQGGIIGVIDGPSRIEASAGLVIAPGAWYTDDLALNEVWNFVHPDHRRTNHAKRLIEFEKNCSDYFAGHGTHLPLFAGVVSNDRTAAKCRLYSRHIPFIGGFFLYNLPKPATNGAVGRSIHRLANGGL